jgi:hypothetical protein
MKRYFFNLSDGGWEPDDIGSELPDDRAAQQEAIRFAGEILKGEPEWLERGQMRVDVQDADGKFGFAIEICLTFDRA